MEEFGGELGDMREGFHEELEKEYRNERGHLLKEELVNLTIARKKCGWKEQGLIVPLHLLCRLIRSLMFKFYPDPKP